MTPKALMPSPRAMLRATIATLLLTAAATGWTVARADVPTTIAESGRLFGADGITPLTGSHSLAFRLYPFESAVAGEAVWTETRSVVLADGRYSMTLGDTLPLPPVLRDHAELWLGVTVDDDRELLPRFRLQSVPYALLARDVQGVINPTAVSIAGTPVIDATGRWVGLPTGLVGPAGAQGLPGPAGARGLPGPAGATGAPGSIGPVGPAGPAGATGATGPAGPAGPAGTAGPPGPPGPQGDRGFQGFQGAQGAQGAAGEPGRPGEPGAEGPAGARGPQGLQGPAGPIGPIGPAGPIGPSGPVGPQGPQGLRGPQGVAGQGAATAYKMVRAVQLPATGPFVAVSMGSLPTGSYFVTAPYESRRVNRPGAANGPPCDLLIGAQVVDSDTDRFMDEFNAEKDHLVLTGIGTVNAEVPAEASIQIRCRARLDDNGDPYTLRATINAVAVTSFER